MALSNIFKEPRRELTESAVGTAVIWGIGYLWFYGGWWLAEMSFHPGRANEMAFAGQVAVWMAAILVCAALAFLLVVFTHFIGEEICSALERRGLQLRPKQRYL